jgi:predicted ATPase with chaperone activity
MRPRVPTRTNVQSKQPQSARRVRRNPAPPPTRTNVIEAGAKYPAPMRRNPPSKISGPLLDRIDIHIDVPAVNYKELRNAAPPEGSAKISTRLMRAREVQLNRFAANKEKIYSNAQMGSRQIRPYCELSPDCERLLERRTAMPFQSHYNRWSCATHGSRGVEP